MAAQDSPIGLLRVFSLPAGCNVIVRETPDRKVEVASVDPVAAMERTDNPALRATAEEVRRLLTKVVSQLGM